MGGMERREHLINLLMKEKESGNPDVKRVRHLIKRIDEEDRNPPKFTGKGSDSKPTVTKRPGNRIVQFGDWKRDGEGNE